MKNKLSAALATYFTLSITTLFAAGSHSTGTTNIGGRSYPAPIANNQPQFFGPNNLTRNKPRFDYDPAALAALLRWLRLFDAGKTEKAFKELPVGVRQIAYKQWVQSPKRPAGYARTRKLVAAQSSTRMSGQPRGNYELFVSNSSFAHKASVTETVVLSREAAGWRPLDDRIY